MDFNCLGDWIQISNGGSQMKSIRVKLWTGMMVLVVVIIVLLWLFQIVFLDKFYSVLEIGDVTNQAENIAEGIKDLNKLDDINVSQTVLPQLENFIYEKQISVEILDSKYRVIYQESSGRSMSMPGMMQGTSYEVITSALEGNKSMQEITHPKFGYEFKIIGIPIMRGNSVEGVMIITMPMASLKETTNLLKTQLLIITGILLIVSLLISYKLSKSFAKPISKISKQAESFANGEYKMRIHEVGDDEIGRLASRMNEMGEALVRNDILQKELIANVSHELRTPLTLIRGYAETLRDVTGGFPDKREKQLGIIIEEAERLGYIVEDILNLSQLQARAVTLDMGTFSLKEMLLSIKEHFELSQEGRQLNLKGVFDLQEDLVGDKQKIQQVFYNLIGNAFHHTTDREPVTVTVISKGGKVRIEVRDEGEGIAKEDLGHVFERYYKGKRTNGKKSEGTGLGLAIVKSILEMHQVMYGVESELGTGTTFWFELVKANSHTSF